MLFLCYPQKVVFVESYAQENLKVTELPTKKCCGLMLPTQKRFAPKVSAENHTSLSSPTKVGFFEKVFTDERKRLGATHI